MKTYNNNNPIDFSIPFLGSLKQLIYKVIPLILLVSCDNFVDVALPNSQLTATAVFEDKATATAAMVEIYNKIRENGILTGTSSGISNQLGNYTDELVCYGSSATVSFAFYNNTLVATNSNIAAIWSNSYNQIYAANSVYEGVNNAVVLTTADRNQLMGEALFVRCLLHFYLCNLYGAIPYINTTDYKENSTVKRIPQAEVYAKIKSDLSLAIELLAENYTTTEKVRPNKYTALALMARLNLYMEDWEEATTNASLIINKTSLYSPTDLDKVFLKNSSTTIWQLMPSVSGKSTNEGATFIFVAGPPPLTALSSELINAFSGNDLRKSTWTKAVSNGSSTWYHAYKYKQYQTTTTTQEYSILFRLAEQYLIRAEANVHLNELEAAASDVNAIRNRAGLTNTTATTADALLEVIQKERRLEFFTELGHRFFDLKRTNQLDAVLSPVKPGWKSTNQLWPIPATEFIVNPNLKPQNLGY